MNPKETVCVHVAASNHDANLLAIFLNNSGIPAMSVEDRSDVGLHTFGALPGIHRPMVYVNRGQEAKAKALITAYEKKELKSDRPAASMFCYYCGAECETDTIDCPKCGRYLEPDDDADLDQAESDSQLQDKESRIWRLRDLKKPIAALLLFMPAMSLIVGGLLVVAALTNVILSLLRK